MKTALGVFGFALVQLFIFALLAFGEWISLFALVGVALALTWIVMFRGDGEETTLLIARATRECFTVKKENEE